MYPRREKMSEKEKMNTQNKKEISGFLKGVEIIGNKLPHPAMLFLLLAVIVVIISHFVAAQGVSVTYFDARAKAEVTKKSRVPAHPGWPALHVQLCNQELYRICPFGNSPCSHARCRCC